jgi:hypothetical protein
VNLEQHLHKALQALTPAQRANPCDERLEVFKQVFEAFNREFPTCVWGLTI